MSRFVSRFILISAAALAAVSFASVASAADTREPDALRIDVRNVNFDSASQVRGLYHRIQAAAAQVCNSDISDPRTAEADATCRQEAVSNAVREIGQPQLSALDDQGPDQSSQLAMTEGNR